MSRIRCRALVTAVVMAVVVMAAGGGAHEVARAQGEPPAPLPADAVHDAAPAAFVADPASAGAVTDTRVMAIENAGQWSEAVRFQVWGGPAGTRKVAVQGSLDQPGGQCHL